MEVEFFSSSGGTYYVGKFIKQQQPKVVKAIYRQLERIERLELNYLTRAGIMKKLHGYNLWEIIVNTGKAFYRIFCVVRENICYLLHGFKKTSNYTKKKEIVTALNRAKQLDLQLALATN